MINQDIRKKVYRSLKKRLQSKYAKIIETSIYVFSNEYAQINSTPFLLEEIYKDKSKMLLKIIKAHPQFIIKSIENNTINPQMIAYMKPSELMNTNITTYEIKPVGTSAFKCDKCKKRNTTVVEKQVRSADEPTTLFITCLECGNVFTIN